MTRRHLIVALIVSSWAGWWFTRDQQGRRLWECEDYAAAATAFQDPAWQGVAWYRAGEFDQAARAFARSSGPEARFNEGNCWVMQGKYDQAVASFDRALELRPDWPEARENRDLAAARAERLKHRGGDQGDQLIGADEVVFGEEQQEAKQETEVTADQAASDDAIQAQWLRRLQSRPADFLKAKFAWQAASESEEPTP